MVVSRDLPLPSSNSVLHPFVLEPLHEIYNCHLLHSVRLATCRRGALFWPPNQLTAPNLARTFAQPHAKDNWTNPALRSC